VKMKSIIASITFIVIFVLSGNVFSEENKRAESQEPSQDAKDSSLEKQDNEKVQKVKYVIDFSNYSGGSVRKLNYLFRMVCCLLKPSNPSEVLLFVRISFFRKFLK